MPSVLFVCTANQCRSPMAEALLRARIAHADPDRPWRVASAGTWAIDGIPARPEARRVMANRGLNLAGHRARHADAALLVQFDLILTMKRSHKEALQIEFPALAGRIYTLSEMVGGHFDIDDPTGGPLAAYEATARELDALIEQGLPRIIALATSLS